MPPKTSAKMRPPNRPGHAPALPWLRMWVLVALLFGSSVGSLEAYWHGRGFRPSVPDSRDLWYFWRQRVGRDDGKVIVFLGTSRMASDISINRLHDQFPAYRFIQLAIAGERSPIGTLLDLAQDKRFHGVVVVEYLEPFFDHTRWNGQEGYYLYSPPIVRLYDQVIHAFCAEHITFLRREFDCRGIVDRLLGFGESVEPARSRRHFNRSVDLDPLTAEERRRTTQAQAAIYSRQYKEVLIPTLEALEAAIKTIDRLTDPLYRGGGTVVFLRLPTSAEQLLIDERFHAKHSYWDHLAPLTRATTIHYQDHPSLKRCLCIDGSHLDCAEATKFTDALAALLQKRGILKK